MGSLPDRKSVVSALHRTTHCRDSPPLLRTSPGPQRVRAPEQIWVKATGLCCRETPPATRSSRHQETGVLSYRTEGPFGGSGGKCFTFPADLDHGVGHPLAASGPRQSTSASEAKHVRGLRRDAERSHRAETVSEAHDLCPRFSQESSATMVHAPGLLRIGGAAYFVWAYLPNGGSCT